MNNYFPKVDIIVILLLGHLFGDFIFQTDIVFKLKLKSKKGLFLHSFFVFLTTFIFLFIFSKKIFFSFLISILTLLSHFFVDLAKNKNNFDKGINFVLDQLLHFFVIIFLSSISNFFVIESIKNIFVYKTVFLLIGLIFILYFLKYLIRSLYEILKIKLVRDKYYYYVEDVEKILLFIFSYMHGYFFLLLPFCIIPRIFYTIKNNKEYLYYDILISFLVSSFSGIVLRKITLLSPFSFFEIFSLSFFFYILFKIFGFLMDKSILLFYKN
ncbi:MAG: DUF3307 domain-containing protein [bacterium]|uniref:ABC-type transport system protein n=2 Tax=Bacteria candidate phyla TaxID=1783234 RepID=A0A101I083_UNCT6|nr:MAG: ABC-type transport system protein [candidate division TA06 bacterium 32_111]KUK86225.1 MAG: ABC-type transport system protein [candidate division TA06 bacterium 34_109]MDI6700413.1 DUF3307 domain-containing protein [bacterium]HAF08225.1 hypothetical protein [candidate division WOR-3 bacterium]HCP16788.1 hypothetical protein [candidate division WOR-3 bacterium]